MKATCYLCTANLIILGICAGVYAFTGFDILKFLSFGSATAYRITLAINAVSALFIIYSLIIFKPYKGLK
ncbi:MAG: hypothetical protein K2K80_07250 [Clostridia bacterium]|nr:hypothetical protein [Clostridia bacterium]